MLILFLFVFILVGTPYYIVFKILVPIMRKGAFQAAK